MKNAPVLFEDEIAEILHSLPADDSPIVIISSDSTVINTIRKHHFVSFDDGILSTWDTFVSDKGTRFASIVSVINTIYDHLEAGYIVKVNGTKIEEV